MDLALPCLLLGFALLAGGTTYNAVVGPPSLGHFVDGGGRGQALFMRIGKANLNKVHSAACGPRALAGRASPPLPALTKSVPLPAAIRVGGPERWYARAPWEHRAHSSRGEAPIHIPQFPLFWCCATKVYSIESYRFQMQSYRFQMPATLCRCLHRDHARE
jgi:hypothetical protein